jgi:hypothetical protein
MDMRQLLTPTKILQWQPGQNLQCKGVVPITTTIDRELDVLGVPHLSSP